MKLRFGMIKVIAEVGDFGVVFTKRSYDYVVKLGCHHFRTLFQGHSSAVIAIWINTDHKNSCAFAKKRFRCNSLIPKFSELA